MEAIRSVGALSYDEKPGIVVGKHTKWARDHEYKRLGTWSLLAGIDLLNGEVLGLVRDRHRSREFVEFLRLADQHYPTGARIRRKPLRPFLVAEQFRGCSEEVQANGS